MNNFTKPYVLYSKSPLLLFFLAILATTLLNENVYSKKGKDEWLVDRNKTNSFFSAPMMEENNPVCESCGILVESGISYSDSIKIRDFSFCTIENQLVDGMVCGGDSIEFDLGADSLYFELYTYFKRNVEGDRVFSFSDTTDISRVKAFLLPGCPDSLDVGMQIFCDGYTGDTDEILIPTYPTDTLLTIVVVGRLTTAYDFNILPPTATANAGRCFQDISNGNFYQIECGSIETNTNSGAGNQFAHCPRSEDPEECIDSDTYDNCYTGKGRRGYEGADLIYNFVLEGGNTDIDITLTNLSGRGDLGMFLYNYRCGTECMGFAEILDTTNVTSLQMSSLSGGNYYLIIDSDNLGSSIEFDLGLQCVSNGSAGRQDPSCTAGTVNEGRHTVNISGLQNTFIDCQSINTFNTNMGQEEFNFHFTYPVAGGIPRTGTVWAWNGSFEQIPLSADVSDGSLKCGYEIGDSINVNLVQVETGTKTAKRVFKTRAQWMSQTSVSFQDMGVNEIENFEIIPEEKVSCFGVNPTTLDCVTPHFRTFHQLAILSNTDWCILNFSELREEGWINLNSVDSAGTGSSIINFAIESNVQFRGELDPIPTFPREDFIIVKTEDLIDSVFIHQEGNCSNPPFVSFWDFDFSDLCEGGSTVVLNAVGDITEVNVRSEWIIQGGNLDDTLTNRSKVVLDDLSPGTYDIQLNIQDGFFPLCESRIDTSITIFSSEPLNSDFDQINVDCFGDSTGMIVLKTNGGNPPYKYEWENGETDSIRMNLPAGQYSATISDFYGCFEVLNMTIIQPDELVLDVEKFDVQCFGGNDGLINLTIEGGTSPYTINWSNDSREEDLDSLAVGNYFVTVTDNNGCTKFDSVFIDGPSAPLRTEVSTMIMRTCNNTLKGMMTALPRGGTPPYKYLWNTGDTSRTLNEVEAGDYSLKVTDDNGCEIIDLVCLKIEQEQSYGGKIGNDQIFCGKGQPEPLENLALPNIPGVPSINIEYVWWKSTRPCKEGWEIYGLGWELIPGAHDVSYQPDYLTSTTYFIRAARKKGETYYIHTSNTITIEIVEPLVMSVPEKLFACSGETVTLNAEVSGGVPPYSITWNQGPEEGPTHFFTVNQSSVVSVTAMDQNGCTTEREVLVYSKPSPNLEIEFSEGGSVGPFCAGDTIYIKANFSNDGIVPTWTTSGNGVLSGQRGSTIYYIASIDDIDLGEIIITASTKDYGGSCELVVDSLAFNVLQEGNECSATSTESNNLQDLVGDRFNSSNNQISTLSSPKKLTLFQNYPNPFRALTRIGFEIEEEGQVQLYLKNTTGTVVKSISGWYDKGYHEFKINGMELSYGVYFYILEANGHKAIRKMVILE